MAMIFIVGIPVICLLIYTGFVIMNGWVFANIKEPKAVLVKEIPFISVIIPARNEEKSIASCLKSVLNQSWPVDRFEVILINDHSTDVTREIALGIAEENPNLMVLDLELEGINSYKKAALTLGISRSKGEIILQTDADCLVHTNWIQTIARYFDTHTALVSGPIQLDYRNHWFEKFQALESMGLVVLGAGSMMRGKPNMVNGANMAFRKSVFEEINGYEGIDGVASGDDELLLQKIHRLGKYELTFARSRDAIVHTRAVSDWGSFKSQRLRWVSKARAYYDKRVNMIQLISYLGFWAFPLLIFFAFFQPFYLGLFFLLILCKIIADYYLMYKAAGFFHKLHLLIYVIPLQVVYIPYVIWIGIAGNLVKNYSWKGRRIQ